MVKARFASLTAGLLARKGEAHPAANSFAVIAGFGSAHDAAETASNRESGGSGYERGNAPSPAVPTLEDELEWMTTMAPPHDISVARAPVASKGSAAPAVLQMPDPQTSGPVPLRRASLTTRLTAPELPIRSGDHPRRVSVSVRLDEARYIRLKLTGLRYHRTSQDILTTAMDAYLTALGIDPVTEAELLALAHVLAKPPGGKR